MLERLHALGRLSRQIDELPVGVAGEPRIAFHEVAQDGDDDFLAEISARFISRWHSVESSGIRRGEQDHRLASCVGLAQRVAPALAGANAVQIDKNVFLAPATGGEPALKGQGLDIILARMADEQSRHNIPFARRNAVKALLYWRATATITLASRLQMWIPKMAALILRRCVSATLRANGQLRPERVNTVDFEERPDGVCNVSIYRQADFRSLRSSGIWFEILERQDRPS